MKATDLVFANGTPFEKREVTNKEVLSLQEGLTRDVANLTAKLATAQTDLTAVDAYITTNEIS